MSFSLWKYLITGQTARHSLALHYFHHHHCPLHIRYNKLLYPLPSIFVPHFFTWTFSHLIQTRCRAFIFLARIASLNHSPFTILMASCDVWFYIIFHSRPSFIHTGRVIKLISMIFRRLQPFQQKSSTERCPINAWRRRQSHDSFTWQGRRFADWPHTDVGGNETHAFIFRWMTSQARIKNARNQRRREKWRTFVLEKIQLCDVCFLFRILFQPISPLLKPVKHAYIHHVSCHNQVRERENDLELISAVGDYKNRLEITNKFHIQQRVFNAKVTAIYKVTLRISMQYGGSNACLTWQSNKSSAPPNTATDQHSPLISRHYICGSCVLRRQ